MEVMKKSIMQYWTKEILWIQEPQMWVFTLQFHSVRSYAFGVESFSLAVILVHWGCCWKKNCNAKQSISWSFENSAPIFLVSGKIL
jgi:hypothetical protein